MSNNFLTTRDGTISLLDSFLDTRYVDKVINDVLNGMYPKNLDKKFGGLFVDDVKANLARPKVFRREQEDCYKLSVVAPAVKREDFTLSLKEDVLTLSYTKGDSANEFFNFNSFTKNWRVRQGTTQSDVSADYTDGILTVTVNKVEAKVPKSDLIEIK